MLGLTLCAFVRMQRSMAENNKQIAPVIRWLGPYPPKEDNMTNLNPRYADAITIDNLIELRRENDIMRDIIRQQSGEMHDAIQRSTRLSKALEDILDFFNTPEDRETCNNVETIIRLRGAIEAMKDTP